MAMNDWQVGDLALCVNDTPTLFWGVCTVEIGCVYVVVGFDTTWPDGPEHGLFLDGVAPLYWGDRPIGYNVKRFRKIHPHTPDAEDEETIRLLNGVPVPEPVA